MSRAPVTSSPAAATTPPPAVPPIRLQIFVDFWNLQLTLSGRERKETNDERAMFHIDWAAFPQVMMQQAATLLGRSDVFYAGMQVFTSYNPKSEKDKKFRKWATTWLDRQPGVAVNCFERKPRTLARCNNCHREITHCSHADCAGELNGTVEKGVDTAIATDMIRLAWEANYDVAVLVTSDADLVPAVDFLTAKGIKVIQAGFPPYGADLSKSCWANFDLFGCRESYRRQPPPPRVV